MKRKHSTLNPSRRFTLSHLYSYREQDHHQHSSDSDITCSICYGILKEPHSHNCTETYCYDCLQKCKNKCPSCREPLDDTLMPSAKILTDKLGKLDVICTICSEITQLDKFVFHHDHLCTVQCTQCQTQLKGHTALKEHEQKCGSRVIRCKAFNCNYLKENEDCCTWRGTVQDYTDHKASCRFLAREQTRLEREQLKTKEEKLTNDIKHLTAKEFFDQPENQISEKEAKSKRTMRLVKQIEFNGNRACIIYSSNYSDKVFHEHIVYPTDENHDSETNMQYPQRLYRCKEDANLYYIIYNGQPDPLRAFIVSYTKQIHNSKGIQLNEFYSSSQPTE